MNVDVSYTLDKLGQFRELETDEKEKKSAKCRNAEGGERNAHMAEYSDRGGNCGAAVRDSGGIGTAFPGEAGGNDADSRGSGADATGRTAA